MAQDKKFTPEEVTDSIYGINYYEPLNFQTGGDSVRYDKKGYSAVGWYKDYYENGKLLHKGYYVDGQLKIYKNYWDNDTLEREFRISDLSKCRMLIYYKTGKLKSDITYYKGNTIKWEDFYPNGQLEFIEEYDKNMEYYIQNKTFAEDGTPQMSLDLTDEKKKLYIKKEYHPNGKLKEEGPIRLNVSIHDYQKDGLWKIYDETGMLTSEETYVYGELNKTVKR